MGNRQLKKEKAIEQKYIANMIMKNIIAIIPSRYGSSRFPGKPLAKIKGKPMIQHVYEKVQKVKCINSIYVATDDKRIYDTVESFGGHALMTSSTHSCGTDRLSECAELLELDDDDLILNIQGDEPLIKQGMILDLISCFEDSSVYMATLKKEINIPEELGNHNVVKVITDVHNNAIYFSRYCIPFERDQHTITHYKHIGVYGYKKWFLIKYSHMAKTSLEKAESLEQLRIIENGYIIRVKETKFQSVGVDTPEQIAQIEKLLEDNINA